MTEIRPLAVGDDVAAWVEVHNDVAPVPITAAELEAYRDTLAGNELHLVALADEEAVGVGFVTVEGDESDAWIGVLPASRRRGIAGALKRAQLAWAKANGYERLETANETRNVPIQRLNERLGYLPYAERVRLRGPLA